MIARFKSQSLAPSVWQPTALKPAVPVLRDRCFECVYVYIVIVVSKCVCHLHNKELLYFTLLGKWNAKLILAHVISCEKCVVECSIQCWVVMQSCGKCRWHRLTRHHELSRLFTRQQANIRRNWWLSWGGALQSVFVILHDCSVVRDIAVFGVIFTNIKKAFHDNMHCCLCVLTVGRHWSKMRRKSAVLSPVHGSETTWPLHWKAEILTNFVFVHRKCKTITVFSSDVIVLCHILPMCQKCQMMKNFFKWC